MNIKNLTPHAITFVMANGSTETVEPCGLVARVAAKTVPTGDTVNGIPVSRTEYGAVEGLPAAMENTIYLVSSLVAARCPERDDVFIPNESVRDEAGRIIGCRSLGRV